MCKQTDYLEHYHYRKGLCLYRKLKMKFSFQNQFFLSIDFQKKKEFTYSVLEVKFVNRLCNGLVSGKSEHNFGAF